MGGLIGRWTSGTTIFLTFSNICPTAFARIPLLIVVRRTMPERGRNGGQKKKSNKKIAGPRLFSIFFPNYFTVENRAGRLLILNLAWERLARSILTSFRFWLEFRESIFSTFFRPFFRLQKEEISVIFFLDLVWERLSSSLLTAFRFWLEFLNTIFQLFPLFPPNFSF